MSLYGLTFHVTPVNLCITFQCNLYISCIMSCENKIVSKLFQNCFNCFNRSELSSSQTIWSTVSYREFIWSKKFCTQLFDMKFHRGDNEC